MRRRSAALLVVAVSLVAAFAAIPASAVDGGDTEVTVGSNDSIFSQNKQNEPAVAIDPAHTNVVVAGANDNIDLEACNAGPNNNCPFTNGVGGSGVYFSFDSGDTWTQPTYTGFSARLACLGDPATDTDVCVPDPTGPIGTLPWYYENGLISDGDPALAFGPAPDGDGGFSWDGSRLYYANLTSSLTGAFKGFEAIAVSRTDDVQTAAEGDVDGKAAWMPPVIVSKQSSADFADKEQIWADNAESSPFFGNVYVCYAEFRGFGAAPQVVSVSRDGGDTWSSKQVSPAHNVAPKLWGQSGCTIRTDSDGVVYLFYEQFQNPDFFFPPAGTTFMVKSFDGGAGWTRPRAIGRVTDPCFALQFDGAGRRCVSDGLSGARNDLSASPSVSIANGAPSGAGATDEIVLTWVGFDAGGAEHVFVRYSTNGGATWSSQTPVETPGDRGYYSAPALSPSGDDLYLVYNAWTTPFRENTTDARSLVGVVLHSDIDLLTGAPTGFTEIHRGLPGDPRGSSQNNMVLEFLGDYVYAAATDDYAVAVWNDARNASPCNAVNEWRDDVRAAGALTLALLAARPAVQDPAVCPATFGNSDIFGGSFADPT
ncbi:MAG: exo-alpha-sialidase [Actinobacteria bacterium]|nr:exo-alpha-sialidase [Actinomycetota bacterium]